MFSYDDNYLLSVGGNDKTIFQWKVDKGEDEKDIYEDIQYSDDEFIEKRDFDNEISNDIEENNDGMFDIEEDDEGVQMMAVKPFLGEVKNLVPSDFKYVKGMDDPPKESLYLHYIHGYRCFDARYMARLTSDGKVLFASAALGVEMDVLENT